MITTALCILLILYNEKRDTQTYEKIDMIEFNTIMDAKEVKNKDNKERTLEIFPRYTQMILWKWNAEYCRYDAMHWVILKDEYGEKHEYVVRKIGDYHVVTVMRMFTFEKPYHKTLSFKTKNLMYSQTTSESDPERLNKKVLEEQYREKPTSLLIDKTK